MDSIKYLNYYVGKLPNGTKGIVASLDEARDIAKKVRDLFGRYKPTSLDDKTFVYSNDVNWSLHLREPTSNDSSPFLIVFDEVENECFRKLFEDNKIRHNLEAIGEI